MDRQTDRQNCYINIMLDKKRTSYNVQTSMRRKQLAAILSSKLKTWSLGGGRNVKIVFGTHRCEPCINSM